MTGSTSMIPSRRGRLTRRVAFALAGGSLFATAACGNAASFQSAASTGGDSVAQAARAQLKDAYAGRFTEPPSGPNPAARGKFVVVTSPGQASPTAKAVADGAVEAAKAIGWQVKLCDAGLDPAKFAPCFRDAIAQGANGIIDTSMDCSLVKEALKQTIAAGIPVVAQYAWDCSVTSPGEPPLFTADVSFGDRYHGAQEAEKKWGEDAAAWALAQTGGKGTILNFTNNEYQSLVFYQEGFVTATKRLCPDCKIVDVPWLVSEFGPQLTAKTQSALIKNPDTTVIQADVNPQLGISQGVIQAGKKNDVKVIGGLGLGIDFDSIRQKQALDAVSAWPLAWWGYASVDTLNQIFNGIQHPTVDQGIGWFVADSDHNMQPEGKNATVKDDFFKSAYLKRWGVN